MQSEKIESYVENPKKQLQFKNALLQTDKSDSSNTTETVTSDDESATQETFTEIEEEVIDYVAQATFSCDTSDNGAVNSVCRQCSATEAYELELSKWDASTYSYK